MGVNWSTPIGPLHVAVRDGVLIRLLFEDPGPREKDFVRGMDPTGVMAAVLAYFDGDMAAFDPLVCDGEGTDFQRAVWRALRDIPVGETTSYGELARRIGAPKAVRAVGAANGANPIAIVVPCHRVVGSNGSLTGYGGGLDRKRWLLAHEARYAPRASGPLFG